MYKTKIESEETTPHGRDDTTNRKPNARWIKWLLRWVGLVNICQEDRTRSSNLVTCPHIPRCFEESDGCWNYDEAKKRVDVYPNFP